MHLVLHLLRLVRALAAVIGSIRRECTDHIVPLNEAHLRKTLNDYVGY